MKKLLLLILTLMSSFFFISTVYAESPDKLEPTREHMVNDYANVLSDKTKQVVLDKNKKYTQSKTQPQVVITTINSTNGLSIADFTNDLVARKNWKIGNKKYNNGVLIIFAKNNGANNVRIHTGYGVESVLTDNKSHEILMKYKKLLKSKNKDDVDKGLVNVFIDVTNVIGDGGAQTNQSSSKGSKAVLIILVLMISGIGVLTFLLRKGLIVAGHSYDGSFGSTNDFNGYTGSSFTGFNDFNDSSFGDSSDDSFSGDFGGGDSGGGGSDI